ncbi:MAG: DUF952 domain-containing protein [Alphaproteobacteria bacterium]|nr:DUF952 domain-containing protein [Alphaproteobacteria bacterium]
MNSQRGEGLQILYKIIDADAWRKAVAAGVFTGAAIDLTDGYIHLSTAAQARDTARLHFAGASNLMLVAIDEAVVARVLKWEPSRGGQLFPHVYGTLDPALILWARPLPWDGAAHVFPAEFGA